MPTSTPSPDRRSSVDGGPSVESRSPLSYWPPDTSEPLRESTIAGILRDAAAQVPDQIGLVAGTADPTARVRRTYAELADEAEAIARVLASRFSEGDRIAVVAHSIPESFVLSFAVAMARMVLVPMNPALREQEVAHVLARSGAAAVLHIDEHRGSDIAGLLGRLRDRLPGLRELISFERWPQLVEAGRVDRHRVLPPPSPSDVAQLVFTSGTTGAPKGAMLTHKGMTNASRLGGLRFGLGPGDVYVNTIPLFHVGGQGTAFQIVQALATDVLVTQFHAGLHLELLETERATHTIGVPTMLLSVIDHADFGRRDLRALRSISSGGAAVPTALIRHIEAALGVRSTIVFGQTEACGYLSQTLLDDEAEDKASTVGRLLPHIEGRVVDVTSGEMVAAGEVGELQVRGFGVMAGYYGDRDATTATIDADSWLRTGDLATMDERGYLKITGRLKDMIVTGGVNVYPAEVEAVIATHPACAQVAVLGVPDRHWGEAVVAVVQIVEVQHDGPRTTEADLDTYVRARLAPYKVPKRWVFADELPVTASGKVQKFLLRDRIGE